MPTTTHSTDDLAALLNRLETVLDQIEQRLEETARQSHAITRSPLAQPFLSDDLNQPRDLFGMPSFEVNSPS